MLFLFACCTLKILLFFTLRSFAGFYCSFFIYFCKIYIYVFIIIIIFGEDLQAGELPVAFVVLKPNQTMPESELVEWTNERTSVYKHLRGGVIFTDAIPKSLSGKLSYSGVKERN
jgi:AMP-binding enzyme C-terminal domain